ncbi:MAG: envelope stress response membrane protein PspB [Woeseiaceae bacterium]|nr:envelope stress response membrane protein PspB [Woeseiaceae bacterium]
MSDAVLALAIVFLVICLPLIIVLHYVTKWKQGREISGDDEQMLEDLWQMSRRIEDRIDTLERILDDESRDWRNKE